jgi:uncharacterized surface protein with fasciclin (FAS1) repeats
MKKLVSILLILINASFVFAQKSDSSINKPVRVRNITGVPMRASNTIMVNLSASSDFSLLTNAITTASLTGIFSGNTPITIFAPENRAFGKLEPGKLDTLMLPAHQAELASLINYHAVAGKITSKDLQRQIKAGNGQTSLTTLSGGKLTARINENRNIVLTDESGGQSVISRFDIQQSNGLLDVITAVLSPAAK